MSKFMKRSNLIRDRLIECSNNNEIEQGDELRIIEHLFNKLNLLSIQEAADVAEISYNGMKKRIEDGKEMSIKIGKLTLVSPCHN